MSDSKEYMIKIGKEADPSSLSKGVYIAVTKATSFPPHIGMVILGTYHSLSVKGQDKNVLLDAFWRNINQRQLPCLFVELRAHSTFSEEYLKAVFITCIE